MRYQAHAPTARARRELAQTRGEATIACAQEVAVAGVVQSRIDCGYSLGEHTVSRMAQLNLLIGELSSDNPELAISMRTLERFLTIGASELIREYINR